VLQVYRHICNNEVIYVGIGSPSRAKNFTNRSRDWKSLVDGKEVYSEVLWETPDREEAYVKEKEFISIYGRRDKNEGTLVNRTDGGGWTKGLIWDDKRRKEYADRARKYGILTKYIENHGAPSKGKKLPSPTAETIQKRVESYKETWNSKTKEQQDYQTRAFRENNPSHKLHYCKYCNRDIQGTSAYNRFHGNNCKNK